MFSYLLPKPNTHPWMSMDGHKAAQVTQWNFPFFAIFFHLQCPLLSAWLNPTHLWKHLGSSAWHQKKTCPFCFKQSSLILKLDHGQGFLDLSANNNNNDDNNPEWIEGPYMSKKATIMKTNQNRKRAKI